MNKLYLVLFIFTIFNHNQLLANRDPLISLKNYMEYNDVPTNIYLGLLSNLPANQVRNISFVNGTCFEYNVYEFDRCKYYSDCCAMTSARPVEQLATGTFSCHSGYYIIDRCPSGADEKVKSLCETFTSHDSDLSLERWPVRGIVNELSYKNIYCAICNGVKPLSTFYLDSMNWRTGRVPDKRRNGSTAEVEWWPARVQCDEDVVEEYLNDHPNHGKLNRVIESSCEVIYQPLSSPDLCFDAVRTCPDSTNQELRDLCEKGTANYINVSSTNSIFRNQFCAMCHSIDVSLNESTQPHLANNSQESVFLRWDGEILTKTNIVSDRTAMVARPTLFSEMNRTLSFTNLSSSGSDFICSFFSDASYNFCQSRLLLAYTEIQNTSSRLTPPIWNLGSFACYSSWQKICDRFLVSRRDVSDESCTKPGCGRGWILDPQTLKCINLNDFRPHSTIEGNDLQWHSHSVCSYRSQCRAAELGFIEERHLNCYCDKFCIYYNDCCEDSPFQPTPETVLDDGIYACVPDKSDIAGEVDSEGYEWGVMQVQGCPTNYPDKSIRALCDDGVNRFYSGIASATNKIPVSDTKTGIKYANMYCAQCHGVQDFQFWRTDIGCIHVANDECRHPLNIDIDEKFHNLTRLLRSDPTIQQLSQSSCSVKQFLPPVGIPDVRRCRVDTNEYISKCPEYAKDWKISELCAFAPTSFVFEGSTLQQEQGHDFTYPKSKGTTSYNATYTFYQQKRKFRNSYCASCNSVAWLGCNVKPSVKVEGGKFKQDLVLRHQYEAPKHLIVYRIDLNKQICELDSDSILLYPNFTSGSDTCRTITRQLRLCTCGYVLDLRSGDCKALPVANRSCTVFPPVPQLFNLPSYVTDICDKNFSYTIVDNPFQKCLECFDACQKVYQRFRRGTFIFPNVHCSPKSLLSCKMTDPLPNCIQKLYFGRVGSSASTIGSKIQTSLLNAVAISYTPTAFDLRLPEIDKAQLNIDAIFSPFFSPSNQCIEYTQVKAEDFLICPDKEIYSPKSGLTYNDYILGGEELQVCTEVKQDFSLETYDYVLTALSIASIIAYTLFYCIKLEHTVTGNFIISSLMTVLAALVFLCLLNQAENKTACRLIATMSHYLFLAVQTWTTAVSVWMFKGIVSFNVARGSGWKTYARYASFAWLTPIIFVILSYIFDRMKIKNLYPVFGENICFIESGWIRLLVFTGPIYLTTLSNAGLCIYATYSIVKAGKNIGTEQKKDVQKKIIIVVKLQIIFGIHWVLILFTEIPGPQQHVLWLILKLFISLQGVTVVATQLLTWKSINKFKSKLSSLVQSTDSTNTQSQSQSRKVDIPLVEQGNGSG